MKTILCILALAVSAPAFAQPGSAGSGSAGSAAGSGSAAAGSGSAAAAGSGSGSDAAGSAASTPAAGSAAGSGATSEPPTPPAMGPPNPVARKACVDAMNAEPAFADSVIKVAEQKLHAKLDNEQVLKDLCTIRNHQESQTEIATNQRHVLLAYVAMWLVAAGFVLFMWRKQQALKREIALLRSDLDAATKDDK